MAESWQEEAESVVTNDVIAPKEQVLEFLGVDSCKIVCKHTKQETMTMEQSWEIVQKDGMCFMVDYGESEPRPVRLPGARPMAPEISKDGTGNTVFTCPEGTSEWQTPQWSNHPDYAIAVAKNAEGKFDVYLVRLSNHATLKVIWGDDCITPFLWCRLS